MYVRGGAGAWPMSSGHRGVAYILGDKPTGCIFCEKIRAQDDAQNLILWRGHTAFVMLNRYPYNNLVTSLVAACHAGVTHGPGTRPTGRTWRTHHAL